MYIYPQKQSIVLNKGVEILLPEVELRGELRNADEACCSPCT